MKALCILVTHDKSANSVFLAEEFDRVCEESGRTKHIAIYQECRFTKLGYSASSTV